MPEHVHNLKHLREVRKDLRNNLTPQEAILWNRLKNSQLGYKFRRQHSIGPYITDFYCAEKKLVIEIDGSQHLDNVEYDKERTDYFNELNIKVLRFWNNEVNANVEGVVMVIKQELEK